MTDRYEALRVVRYSVDYKGLSVSDDGHLVSYDAYATTKARLQRAIEERDDTVKEWGKMKAERDALAAQVEVLKEDAERLDWLDEMNAALNSHYGTKYRWKVIMSPMITRLMTGTQRNGHVGDIDLNDANCGVASYESCRHAIDAARKEQS